MEPLYIYTSARQARQWYNQPEETSSKTPAHPKETRPCCTCCREEKVSTKA